MKKRILIIGPVPPPYGGVCVHIIRLYHFMKSDFDFDFIDEIALKKKGIFNIRSKRFDIYLKKILTTDIVFIHSGTSFLRYFNLFVSRIFFKKVILTIHSYPAVKGPVNKWLDELFFGLANKVILVNSIIAERVKIKSSKLLIKNAFLPPLLDVEPEIPDEIRNWMENKRQNGSTILVGNASKLELFDNVDLYGLDLCIEAMAELKRLSLNAVMVFNVSDTQKYKDRYLAFKGRINQLGLSDSFQLISEQISFYRLMMLADIVVRPTNTDGDALTIREAIHLGKPIIASDVIPRPPETLVFKNRNVHSFVEVIKNTMGNLVLEQKLDDSKDNNQVGFYKDLFEQLLKN